MANVNFKPLIEEKVEDFKKDNPDYTYGQILYSALKVLGTTTRAEILALSDEDLYTGLDNALKLEEPEEEFFVKN